MTKLLVIGNGFDKAHDIPSGYYDFKIWLGNNDNETIERMSLYFPSIREIDSDWWQDFENNLDKVDAHDEISRIVEENYPNFASDDFRDADNHAAEFAMRAEMDGLYSDIQSAFEEWIASFEFPSTPKFILREYDMFLTFNYTSTLETLYNVDASRILYIHGRASANERLIIGHSCNPDHYTPGIEFEMPEPPDDVDTPEEIGDWYENHAEDYFASSARAAARVAVEAFRKPTDQIIDKNRIFFGRCNRLEQLSFFGFSFAHVDMPYIREIARNMKSGAIWKIYCHSDGDYNTANQIAKEFSDYPFEIQVLPSKSFCPQLPTIPGLS